MQVRDEHRHHRARCFKARTLTCRELQGIEKSRTCATRTERAATLPFVDERDCRGIHSEQWQASEAQPIRRRRTALARNQDVLDGRPHDWYVIVDSSVARWRHCKCSRAAARWTP